MSITPLFPKFRPFPPTQPTSSPLRFSAYNAKRTRVPELSDNRQYDIGGAKIFTGRGNPQLAKEVAKILGTTVSPAILEDQKNGEVYVNIEENVRGRDTFIFQSASGRRINDFIMEALAMVDALQRAEAKSITVILPYYPYSRSDRRAEHREPILARLLADLLKAAGATRVITMDLHADQIEGCFKDPPLIHLSAKPLLAGYLALKGILDKLVIVSPDVGGVKRASKFSQALSKYIEKLTGQKIEFPLVIINKGRPEHGVAEVHHVIGEVKGKVGLMFDDMIDTAGTLRAAAQALVEQGIEEVLAMATHPIFSKGSAKNLGNTAFNEVIVTNTLGLGSGVKKIDNVTQLSAAPIFAKAIGRILAGESLSDISAV